MAVWLDLVRFAHGVGMQSCKGRAVLEFVPRCADPECPYHTGAIQLPKQAVKRFKNLITNRADWAKAFPEASEAPPFLFCGECGCATCATPSEMEDPVRARYLSCRRMEHNMKCNLCGWKVKYPPCPMLSVLTKKFAWRCRHATATSLGQAVGPAPKPKRGGKAYNDSGVIVNTTFAVFFQTLEDKMDEWAQHEYRHQHSLKMRRRAIANVSRHPPGNNLVILLDWADKLQLAPAHLESCARYFQIGVMVMVCVFREEDGVVAETHYALCEEEAGDVPYTQESLWRVIRQYIMRARSIDRVLARLRLFSDGGNHHYKLALSMLCCVHLQARLRAMTTPSSVLLWLFLESNHGKGPYDPEGGVLKHAARRMVCFGNAGWANTYDVYLWARECQSLLLPTSDAGRRLLQMGPQNTHLPQFVISRRFVIYIAAADLCDLQLSFARVEPAARSVDVAPAERKLRLRMIAQAYTLTFDDLPRMRPYVSGLAGGLEVAVGVAVEADTPDAALITDPYSRAGLCGTVPHTGTWSRYQCMCDVCDGLESGEDAACRSQGEAASGFCTVRKPEVKFLQATVLSKLVAGFDGLQSIAGANALKAALVTMGLDLRIYVSQSSCRKTVEKVFKQRAWVQAWLEEKKAGGATVEIAATVLRLRAVGWQFDQRGNTMRNPDREIAAFLRQCLSEEERGEDGVEAGEGVAAPG